MSALNLSRRGLFAGSAAAIVVPSAAGTETTAAHPDAALIRLCDEFVALQQTIRGHYEGPMAIKDDNDRDAALAPLLDQEDVLLDGITAAPATTLAGHIAIARAAAAWAASEPEPLETDLLGRLQAHLMNGLVGGAA